MADALHEIIKQYEAAEAAYNATSASDGDPATERAVFSEAYDALKATTACATTYDGAMAALRFAHTDMNEFASNELVKPLVNGALAYFENLEKTRGCAPKKALEMVEWLDLSKVRGTGWWPIYQGLTHATDSLNALSQLSACAESPHVLNASGEYLSALSEFLLEERGRFIDFAKTKVPIDKEDRERLLLVIIEAEIYNGDLSIPQLQSISQTIIDGGDEKTPYAAMEVAR